MKKTLLLISISLLFINVLFINAQSSSKSLMNLQAFEKNKQEFIIKEAGLTQEEADKFFPLNTELQRKKLELHRKYRENLEHTKERVNISDEEYEQLINENINIKMKENNILSFNFRVPSALRDEVLEYFNRFQMGEPTAVDIGGTGDIKCIFKGISPVLREENASEDYYALSVLLQETGKTVPSEEELCETCSHCGFH